MIIIINLTIDPIFSHHENSPLHILKSPTAHVLSYSGALPEEPPTLRLDAGVQQKKLIATCDMFMEYDGNILI